MDYNSLKESIFQLLGESLPEHLSYHGLHHTRDVLAALEIYLVEEKIDKERDQILPKTGAVLHDCGFSIADQNHEENRVKIARATLGDFGYTHEEIEIVADMILATKVPQRPQSHLEEILCDCDLDYLGKEDFESISMSLFAEWKAYQMVKHPEEFEIKQIRFMESHSYFTEFARKNRDPKKQKTLQLLKEKIK